MPPSPAKPCGLSSLSWLAVRAASAQDVADAIGLQKARPCDWAEGQKASFKYGNGAFITSAVKDGWIVVAGAMPYGALTESAKDPFLAFLKDLSARFGEVQFFSSDNSAPYATWALCRNGMIVRAYAFETDPDCRILWNVGEDTEAEQNLKLTYSHGQEGPVPHKEYQKWLPHEEATDHLSAAWSFNPHDLSAQDGEPGVGLLGTLRASWSTDPADYRDDIPPGDTSDEEEDAEEFSFGLQGADLGSMLSAAFGSGSLNAQGFSTMLGGMLDALGGGKEPSDEELETAQQEMESHIRAMDTRHLMELYAAEKGYELPNENLGRNCNSVEELAEAFTDLLMHNLPPLLPREAVQQMAAMATGMTVKHYRGQVRGRDA